jgi:hypothetical protein
MSIPSAPSHFPPLFPLCRSKLLMIGASFWPSSYERASTLCPWSAVSQSSCGPWVGGPSPRDFPFKNKSQAENPSQIYKEAPTFILIQPTARCFQQKFHSSPWFWNSIYILALGTLILHKPLLLLQIVNPCSLEPQPSSKYTPINFPKSRFHPWTSIIHIFSTITPNQVILVSKFSESHPHSFQAIHILMIVCLSIREFILKLTNEDFQDQIYEDLQERVYGDFKTKYTRIPIFSFQSNEASVLDHIAPNTFLSIL